MQSEPFVPKLFCYQTQDDPPVLQPGGSRRGWMDETIEHFAYRCTPMVIANATGWELLSPYHIEAEWDGRASNDGIIIKAKGDPEKVRRFVCSHFGNGVLTFHPGYVFRTSPGWAILARGLPNAFKPSIVPLEGLIETEWLPFTFTMNWRFTQPGKAIFEKDEPFCFITLAPHGIIDQVTPRVSALGSDEALKSKYLDWKTSRKKFNAGLNDPASPETEQGWQKRYLAALEAPDRSTHKVKRRLRRPIALDTGKER